LNFALIMSLVGAGLTITIMVYHKISKTQLNQGVPYAVAIAAAGIWALCQQYINQFA
jgi:prepilin peptidase CpaA